MTTITTTGSGTEADPYIVTLVATSIRPRLTANPFSQAIEALDGVTEVVIDISASTGTGLTTATDFSNVTKVTFQGETLSSGNHTISMGDMLNMRDDFEIVFASDFNMINNFSNTAGLDGTLIKLAGDWGANTKITIEDGATVAGASFDGINNGPINSEIQTIELNVEAGGTLTNPWVVVVDSNFDVSFNATANVAPGANILSTSVLTSSTSGTSTSVNNFQENVTLTYNLEGATITGDTNNTTYDTFYTGYGADLNDFESDDTGAAASVLLNADGATFENLALIQMSSAGDVVNFGALDGQAVHLDFKDGPMEIFLGAGNDVFNLHGGLTYSVNPASLDDISTTIDGPVGIAAAIRGDYAAPGATGLLITAGEGIGTEGDGSIDTGDIGNFYSDVIPDTADMDVLNFTAIDAAQLAEIEASLMAAGAVQNANGDWVSGDPANDTIRPFSILMAGATRSDEQIWFADFEQASLSVLCYEASTGILTAEGEKPAGALKSGDWVITKDHGAQPIEWVGQSRCILKPGSEHNRPVIIRAGALGKNLPNRDMRVSPQHRMLISSRISERMTGENETLVAAKHLIGMDGIEYDQAAREVEYVHIMTAEHAIIYAEGAPSETFFPGEYALKNLDEHRRQKQDFFNKNPKRLQPKMLDPVRAFMQGRQARNLTKRHIKNNVPVLEHYEMSA